MSKRIKRTTTKLKELSYHTGEGDTLISELTHGFVDTDSLSVNKNLMSVEQVPEVITVNEDSSEEHTTQIQNLCSKRSKIEKY